MFYEAIYQPRNEDKLSDKAKKFIGRLIAIQDGGQEETAPGKSQVVYIASPNIGIIPNTDLENITSIPNTKWTALSKLNAQDQE
ncbi:hypothetical protein SAMN02746065_102127 [Desulfocicer vacuolatum DSM 3385]|uniref:Uncharacterized protein n=1 Tax=Desulfocicer vacuolatum DSM 3385 TaxID=1121400 RepID=A0A1W1Z7E9_9BACT|nr:hypothetical protein [Desulfocicer vacuolatum]SMC44333.1 hypothetical protein SAMN02746065_102127 [Desulfocicer vacuolatum DSM 3385]